MPLPNPPKARHQPTESPSPTLPKGRELILAVFEAVGCGSFPLGKVGMGLLLVRFALAEGWWMGLKKSSQAL